MSSNPRICAAHILTKVIFEKKSLSEVLPLANKSKQINLTKELCFGVCRYYFQLKHILKQLVTKPIKSKEAEIECLLLIGIYELSHLNTAKYAVVSELVECTKTLKKNWATNLVNGVLRNFLRHQPLEDRADLESTYNHPTWLIKKIKKAWPKEWEKILDHNNTPAPLTLRINPHKTSLQNYLTLLSEAELSAHPSPVAKHALILGSPCPVTQLPNFADGFVSVQDVNAQLAAEFLSLSPGLTVLDACAAPGGKFTHLLETERRIAKLIAIDHDKKRIQKIHENLTRLDLNKTKNTQIQILTADVNALSSWWDKHLFDRILLDAPCSSTGVIRRHPDIKLLRQESDITKIAEHQRTLLQTLWRTLKPNGLLLYVTCSILPEENVDNIKWLLENFSEAEVIPLPQQSTRCEIGLQLLPGDYEGDGFYYCLIKKSN